MPGVEWTRPAGPPIVWKIIDVKENISDGELSPVRLSIQDIPEDRYGEALDHMCEYFIADEVRCKYLKVKENPSIVQEFRSYWSDILKQGMSIGAFKLDSNGKLGELIGMNVLLVPTGAMKKNMKRLILNSKFIEIKKIFTVLYEASKKIDVCKTYGADEYITSMGLSVKPNYRGKKLAVHLLEVRKDIGRKYGISLTLNSFGGPSSQIQAERAGFETVLTMRYDEFVDENGQPVFPNIEAESLKIMAKKL